MFNIFILIDYINAVIGAFKNKHPIKETSLENRIEEAKRKVKVTRFLDFPFVHVENLDEIIEILGYKKTLGIALFVKFFIAEQRPTKECIEYLTR